MGWDARIDIRLLIIKYFIIYIMLQVTHILVYLIILQYIFQKKEQTKRKGKFNIKNKTR